MNTKKMFCIIMVLAGVLYTACVFSQTAAFTYQGRLLENGSPAEGLYDLKFELFDAATNGLSRGAHTNLATQVSNGLFTVMLDFGSSVFSAGDDRWLEIGTATNGGNAFITLSPRHQITSVPYALFTSDAMSASYASMAGSADTVSGTISAGQLTGTISSNNIGAGSITTPMLATGAVGSGQLAADAVTTEALADGAVTLAKMETQNLHVLNTTFTNPTPAGLDNFGYSAAAMGSELLFIGAYRDDTIGENSGAVYLYHTDGTLINTYLGTSSNSYFGHSIAVLSEYSSIAIGSYLDDTAGLNAGAVYLYTMGGIPNGIITNTAAEANDWFGYALASLGEDRIIIGSNAEEAYVVGFNEWITFTNPAPITSESFGRSVAAVGSDKVLIGSPSYLSSTKSGSAYLFDTDGGLLAAFTSPASSFGDHFGYSLAAVGEDKVLIGAYGDDTGAANAGAAYLFSTGGVLLATFVNPDPAINDEFGRSVTALGDHRVIIGSANDDTDGTNAGKAYLFALNGTLITSIENPDPAPGDLYGSSVFGLDGRRVLITAQNDDAGGENSGTAYLFDDLETFMPGLAGDGVRPGSIVADSLAAGSVTASSIAYGAVGDSQLAADAVTSFHIQANAVRNAEISDNAVGNAELMDEAVGSAEIMDGSIVAEDIDAATFSNVFWKTDGNAGVTGGFLGYADNQPLEFRVNNTGALILEYPAVGSVPNLIGGFSGNTIAAGTEAAVIAGGGGSGYPNTIAVDADFSTLSGGMNNLIDNGSKHSTLAGGYSNRVGVNSDWSTIGGGYKNSIESESIQSAISGGGGNSIGTNADYSVVGGGHNNTVSSDSRWSVIAGGEQNDIGENASHSTINGGRDNDIWNDSGGSSISGGELNDIYTGADNSVICGGYDNNIKSNAYHAVIAGGYLNTIGDGASRSFSAGSMARADHPGTFVWADSEGGRCCYWSQ